MSLFEPIQDTAIVSATWQLPPFFDFLLKSQSAFSMQSLAGLSSLIFALLDLSKTFHRVKRGRHIVCEAQCSFYCHMADDDLL